MTGTKVTKAQIKEFPAEVQEAVFALMKRYRTRNVKYSNRPEGFKLYLAEGASYTAFFKGQKQSIQMMSQSSLHAGGGWQAHQVGSRIELPLGAWVVEFELFLGKPFITVFNVNHKAIGS